ncbi:response regulator transcription factor [Streptomyces radicis]|uniref:DNA-binding response regulator n=1 Tax=Streptomyces radicis TaxID=1750517 RepID=A0A3A9WF03_9ACTN|nr:response regulator transcription factor [Streptomyces radicis]RKN10883.1 DNA-binding response regulator [Streptomyces radicis]RKN25147.1 DNA-binding response regulator [Streptomyces radicis]
MADPPLPPAPPHILVVEDDPDIHSLLVTALRAAGYAVSGARTGGEALAEVGGPGPDLVVLDVMLPDISGFDVTRRMRAAGVYTPVLFLTALGDLADRITGLSSGGDDYVPKPFHVEEVLLRVRAILRRAGVAAREGAADEGVLRFADLEVDLLAHDVSRAGRPLRLSPTELRLLVCLLSRPCRVLGKAEILQEVWRYDFAGDTRIVDTFIKYLRKKVDARPPPLIHTVRGVGYCLRLPRGDAGAGQA